MIHDESTLHPRFQAPFDAALDDIPDALAIFTADDYPITARIVYVNAAFLQLSGYTLDQLLGHSSMLLAGAHADHQYVSEFPHAAKGATFFASRRKFRPDGGAYDVDLWLSPLRDGSGPVTHYLLRERDVTNRDRDPSEAQARRLLAESLICAGRLAAGTAYELEQALTRIDLHLNAVLDALESGEARDVAPAVRHALAETDHAGAVMHGLEAFLEPDEERVRPLDVHEAIEIALKLTKVITDRRATLVRRYGVVPLGMASLRRLTHVLVALLRNAANAIPAASPHANSIVVETSTTLDGRAAIEISDTGVGVMFDEHLARVLYATFDDAVEDLALGGPYDLVVCNGRSADCEEFRMRLHESAPDVLSRTLDVVIPPRGSGLFQRVAVLEHEVDVAAVAE